MPASVELIPATRIVGGSVSENHLEDEAKQERSYQDGLQSFTPLSTPTSVPSLGGPLNGIRRINYECFINSCSFCLDDGLWQA